MTTALSVKQLRKIYSNNVIALNSIDLDVEEGDFFALLGQNGAGKSTTIGITCSLINKTSGSVSVFGHDIDTQSAEAKSLIGVVPQETNFSLFENPLQILINQAGYYGIPRKTAKKRAEMYLTEMGIWPKHKEMVIRLSGGMKRRLMIARALMNEPKLLILDEPTAGVDIELRYTLWQFLKNLNKNGTTIILTTHYLEEAEQLCKNVAIIDKGDIIEHTNMKSLINRVHKQTLVLDLVSPISSLPQLDNFTCRLIDNMTLEIDVHRGQAINDVFTLLTAKNFKIASLRNKMNRLEELFMTLVTKNNK